MFSSFCLATSVLLRRLLFGRIYAADPKVPVLLRIVVHVHVMVQVHLRIGVAG